MQATITKFDQRNARNLHGEKELVLTLSAIARERPGAGTPLKVWAEARIYVSRSARWAGVVHCSLWVRAHEGLTNEGKATRHVSGYGRATGGGYHKASGALASAIRSAGIELSEGIDGRGENAMEEALRAIALAAMGLDHPAGTSILVHRVGG